MDRGVSLRQTMVIVASWRETVLSTLIDTGTKHCTGVLYIFISIYSDKILRMNYHFTYAPLCPCFVPNV